VSEEQLGLGFGACESAPDYEAVEKKEPFSVINFRFIDRAALEDFQRRIPNTPTPRIYDTAGSDSEAYKPIDEGSVRLPIGEPWEKEWQDMPEFIQNDVAPYAIIAMPFESEAAIEECSRRLEQPSITAETKSAWHPERGDGLHMQSDKCYINTAACECENGFCFCGKDTPKYPIYILSKGRWERRLTADSLEEIGVDYKIVVEPQEFSAYAEHIDKRKIIVTPFSNLGKGGIPARNFIWEHALAAGHKRVWTLDDNIHRFYRLHNNKKIPVADGTCFRAIEQFCDRYTNIALAGINYQWLCKATDKVPPVYINTRIYSCLLIDTSLRLTDKLSEEEVKETHGRWRGRYNEDTDLSLRAMKAGLCTVMFNSFLCGKASTMTMKGGNTDELYKDDGRKVMSDELVAQHSDVASTSWKFNRYQHHVDYRRFVKNRLKRREDYVAPGGVNNFGMTLVNKPIGEAREDKERQASSVS
jgi:hypothetical protein